GERQFDGWLAACARGLAFSDNEAAARREIGFFRNQTAPGVKGTEAHAIGMEGKSFVFVEEQVELFVEGNGAMRGQRQLSCRSNRRQLGLDRFGSPLVGKFAA